MISDPRGRTIVVGATADDRAGAPVRTALALAEPLGSSVEFVHGVPVPRGSGFSSGKRGSINAHLLAAAQERILERLRPLAAEEMGEDELARRTTIVPGPPAKVLVDHAAETGAGLLIVGPHRRTEILDFGNTVRALIASAPCPLWVQGGEARPIRRILATTDLSEASEPALEVARNLARVLDARIELLHVHAPVAATYAAPMPGAMTAPVEWELEAAESARRRFAALVDDAPWKNDGLEFESVFRSGPVVDEILDRAHESDLVVMGSHGQTGLAAAVLGRVSYAVLRHSDCPVVLVRAPRTSWLLPARTPAES